MMSDLGSADIDARLEELLIDGILYAFQEQVSAPTCCKQPSVFVAAAHANAAPQHRCASSAMLPSLPGMSSFSLQHFFAVHIRSWLSGWGTF